MSATSHATSPQSIARATRFTIALPAANVGGVGLLRFEFDAAKANTLLSTR